MSVGSLRVQFPVRKRGSMGFNNWSTRTLTIDTDTATVTISRQNHPNNIFYHALQVRVVQMWPRFRPEEISDDYLSLKAKMTIRVIGLEVPVPYFDASEAAFTNTSSFSTAPVIGLSTNTTDTAAVPPNIADFSFIAGDYTKKSRRLKSGVVDGLFETWVLRFTSIESYEAAVRVLACLRNPDGSIRKVYGSHVETDLAEVRRAWATRHGTYAAAQAQQIRTLPQYREQTTDTPESV